MYISKVVPNYIFFEVFKVFEVFNQSGKCPLKDASTQVNNCWAFVWLGKSPSEMCLAGKVSVGDVPGRGSFCRGCVWSGKCPSGMRLVREMSAGEVSVGEESVREMSVGNVSRNFQNSSRLTFVLLVKYCK